MKILVVDSHNDQRPDARLPRLLASLGQFGPNAEGFRSVRRLPDNEFHDLSAYDVALVHESDARLDNGGFYKVCARATTPCVLFSGDTGRATAQSPRLLFLSDSDATAHAEAGLLFWRRTGRLDLTAWTQGLAAARRAEVHRLCDPLRKVLRLETADALAVEWDAIEGLPARLRDWGETPGYHQAVEDLCQILGTRARPSGPRDVSWLREHRERLHSLVRRLVATA